MSSSLSDLVGSPLEISVDNVLTIEELRQHMGSCFTCGVSWTDDHVSLDCSECGGYSVERPCPLCDGQCGVQWKRDFTMVKIQYEIFIKINEISHSLNNFYYSLTRLAKHVGWAFAPVTRKLLQPPLTMLPIPRPAVLLPQLLRCV